MVPPNRPLTARSTRTRRFGLRSGVLFSPASWCRTAVAVEFLNCCRGRYRSRRHCVHVRSAVKPSIVYSTSWHSNFTRKHAANLSHTNRRRFGRISSRNRGQTSTNAFYLTMRSMEPPQSVHDRIRELEEQLLLPEVRSSRRSLEELLGDEFIEIASDGNDYTNDQIVDALQAEPPVSRSLAEFRLVALADDVVLATFRSTRRGDAAREVVVSLRSSIWKQREGGWQMVFHQGTNCVAP